MADDKTDSARQMLRLALANLQLEIGEKHKTGSNGALDLTAATAQVFDAEMTAMEEQQHLRAARQAILGNASADKAWISTTYWDFKSNAVHAFLTAHRPRGDFGLAAVAEQQQWPLPPTIICGFLAA